MVRANMRDIDHILDPQADPRFIDVRTRHLVSRFKGLRRSVKTLGQNAKLR